MSSKVKEAIALAVGARNKISSAIVSALSAYENTGLQLTGVCETLQSSLHGQAIGDEDSKSIIGAVARAKGWKGASLKVRSSEVGAILRAYATLPEAVESYKNCNGHCDMPSALRMARFLNRGDSVKQAVKKARASKAQSKGSSPAGRTAAGLKAWYKVANATKKTAILKAAEILGIKLGVKVSA